MNKSIFHLLLLIATAPTYAQANNYVFKKNVQNLVVTRTQPPDNQGSAGLISVNSVVGSTFDYSSTVTGTSKINTFNISNSGNKVVNISQVTLTDAPANLSITRNTCSAPLSPTANCEVSVTYAPKNKEPSFNAKLTVISDAQNSTSTATLTGSGVSPLPTVGPLNLPSNKKVGDPAYIVTNPSSTSSGSWVYSSSPEGIVSFNGNTMSFLTGGTTTVIATQNATSNYESVSVSANITVLISPSLGSFTVPSKLSNSPPFTLTPPTSNSSGTWSYSSSNTAVATVSGNTVTIKGVGSADITASQGVSPPYAAGSKTATLTVTQAYGPDVVVVNGTAFSNARSNPYYSSGAKNSVAATYCANATIGGVTGWRLPTITELYSFYAAYDLSTRNSLLFNSGNFGAWTSDTTDGANYYYAVVGSGLAPGYQTAKLWDQRQYYNSVICARK